MSGLEVRCHDFLHVRDVLTNDWRLGDLFRGHLDDRPLVGIVVNQRHVVREDNEVGDRQTIAGKEGLTSWPLLELVSNLTIELEEVRYGLVDLVLLGTVCHPGSVGLGDPEVCRRLQRPINQIALLQAHAAFIEAILAAKHAQNSV